MTEQSATDLVIAANLSALEGIIVQVQQARDEIGQADYRFARAAEFAADSIKSGYWAVDIQDCRRDLADAEHAMQLAQQRINTIRVALDRL
jgi:hypothetical protein